jgi:hypothetical protein
MTSCSRKCKRNQKIYLWAFPARSGSTVTVQLGTGGSRNDVLYSPADSASIWNNQDELLRLPTPLSLYSLHIGHCMETTTLLPYYETNEVCQGLCSNPSLQYATWERERETEREHFSFTLWISYPINLWPNGNKYWPNSASNKSLYIHKGKRSTQLLHSLDLPI